jgi:hypothetical protein
VIKQCGALGVRLEFFDILSPDQSAAAVMAQGSGELPLSHAEILRNDSDITITVNSAQHPSCALAGKPVSFTCSSAGAAGEWEALAIHAVEDADGLCWGVSRDFLVEEHEIAQQTWEEDFPVGTRSKVVWPHGVYVRASAAVSKQDDSPFAHV